MILYICRHCQKKLGEVQDIAQDLLGFDTLNHHEKSEMLSLSNDGMLKVNVICENCEQILNQYPQLHQFDTFIH